MPSDPTAPPRPRTVMLAAGERAQTLSGRHTAPFPHIDLSTDRRTKNTLLRVDAWLTNEARTELEHQGSTRAHMIQCGVINTDPTRLTTADRNGFNLLLFGTLH